VFTGQNEENVIHFSDLHRKMEAIAGATETILVSFSMVSVPITATTPLFFSLSLASPIRRAWVHAT
jgi:hypothetical protein